MKASRYPGHTRNCKEEEKKQNSFGQVIDSGNGWFNGGGASAGGAEGAGNLNFGEVASPVNVSFGNSDFGQGAEEFNVLED